MTFSVSPVLMCRVHENSAKSENFFFLTQALPWALFTSFYIAAKPVCVKQDPKLTHMQDDFPDISWLWYGFFDMISYTFSSFDRF